MEYLLIFLLLISASSFTQANVDVYINARLMDLKRHEWKPNMLNKMEQVLDAELKYTDERKGVACKAIRFELEPGYPKQHERFLDVSFRGICTDDKNKEHIIDPDLITKAIIQKKDQVRTVLTAIVFRIGNVRLYQRDRNKLNLIIIPVSIGFVVFLFILTYFLRRMRIAQKRLHIISELQKKKEATAKKAQTIANIDPQANDKQRLLQHDSIVVGNVSNTMGSPKEFTNEQYPTPTRNNAANTIDQRAHGREYQGAPPPAFPSVENRVPYYNRENEVTVQTQRPLKPSRERMHVPYENESSFSPTHSQYPEIVPMHEQNPRVIVRSVRDDGAYPMYRQQPDEDSSKTFVSIPVQIEHSGTHQRYFPPPYHSDPYYPHVNS